MRKRGIKRDARIFGFKRGIYIVHWRLKAYIFSFLRFDKLRSRFFADFCLFRAGEFIIAVCFLLCLYIIYHLRGVKLK